MRITPNPFGIPIEDLLHFFLSVRGSPPALNCTNLPYLLCPQYPFLTFLQRISALPVPPLLQRSAKECTALHASKKLSKNKFCLYNKAEFFDLCGRLRLLMSNMPHKMLMYGAL